MFRIFWMFFVFCGAKKKVFVFYANISKTVKISYQSVPSCRICRQTFYLHGWLQLEQQSQGFFLWCVMENCTKSSLCDSIHPQNFQDFILLFMSEYYLTKKKKETTTNSPCIYWPVLQFRSDIDVLWCPFRRETRRLNVNTWRRHDRLTAHLLYNINNYRL